jgi:hypothetical protein
MYVGTSTSSEVTVGWCVLQICKKIVEKSIVIILSGFTLRFINRKKIFSIKGSAGIFVVP